MRLSVAFRSGDDMNFQIIKRFLKSLACFALVHQSVVVPVYAAPTNCNYATTNVRPLNPINTLTDGQRRTADPEVLNLTDSPIALDNRGLIDGVYACEVILDGKTEEQILSFNGHSDGSTIYAVAELNTHYEAGRTSPSAPIHAPFHGWGLGQLSGEEFSGTTWNNQPFRFTLLGLEDSHNQGVYDVLRIEGYVGIAPNQTAHLYCKTDRALFY